MPREANPGHCARRVVFNVNGTMGVVVMAAANKNRGYEIRIGAPKVSVTSGVETSKRSIFNRWPSRKKMCRKNVARKRNSQAHKLHFSLAKKIKHQEQGTACSARNTKHHKTRGRQYHISFSRQRRHRDPQMHRRTCISSLHPLLAWQKR